MIVYICLSLLLKRIVQKVQRDVSGRWSCLFEKSDCKCKSLLRSRRYFLSHGNSRGNLDIEINNNVHHTERHNMETVYNRARFPWTAFFLSCRSFRAQCSLLYYSVIQIAPRPISFETNERISLPRMTFTNGPQSTLSVNLLSIREISYFYFALYSNFE